jgi:hypothetical protein
LAPIVEFVRAVVGGADLAVVGGDADVVVVAVVAAIVTDVVVVAVAVIVIVVFLEVSGIMTPVNVQMSVCWNLRNVPKCACGYKFCE